MGAGELMRLIRRVLSFKCARSTIRNILIRNRELIATLEAERRKKRRRIRVKRALELWGIDFTLVWRLGLFPIWVIGVVDYQGSRIIALERIPQRTAEHAIAVLRNAFEREGIWSFPTSSW